MLHPADRHEEPFSPHPSAETWPRWARAPSSPPAWATRRATSCREPGGSGGPPRWSCRWRDRRWSRPGETISALQNTEIHTRKQFYYCLSCLCSKNEKTGIFTFIFTWASEHLIYSKLNACKLKGFRYFIILLLFWKWWATAQRNENKHISKY